MSEVFLKVLNMSISGTWMILVVPVLRAMLKKAPKWISVLLWCLAGFRLLVPFSFPASYSLMPAETIPSDIVYAQKPAIDSGITVVDHTVNPVLQEYSSPVPEASINPLQVWTAAGSVLWVTGMVVLTVVILIQVLRMKRKLAESVRVDENVYICDHIGSPFVFGIFRPEIYLPSSLPEADREHVLAHEKAHIERNDHLLKAAGCLAVVIHWFNPFVWYGFSRFAGDIEKACDEKVIREMDHENRKGYAKALLDCSLHEKNVSVFRNAFAETGIKARIRNVLEYRKPAGWIAVCGIILCLFTAGCFLTERKNSSYDLTITIPANSPAGVYYTGEEITAASSLREMSFRYDAGDSEVVLVPVEINDDGKTYYLNGPAAFFPLRDQDGFDMEMMTTVGEERTEPCLRAYVTPGMAAKLKTEKNNWYKVGMHGENNTGEEMKITVHVSEAEVRIRDGTGAAVRADGRLYRLQESGVMTARSAVDGRITSSVPSFSLPEENDQSNFGGGSVYQIEDDHAMIVLIGGQWYRFTTDEESVVQVLPDQPTEKDPIFINSFRSLINEELWEQFAGESNEGRPADIIIANYTVEGDVIYTTVHYDGEIFHLTIDNTRDGFGTPEIVSMTRKYMYVLEWTRKEEFGNNTMKDVLYRYAVMSDKAYDEMTAEIFEQNMDDMYILWGRSDTVE